MEEPKSFHDVARPGNTPQSPTSRPIIVGREPLMQDPMMKGTPQPEKPALPDHKDEPTMTPPTLTAAPASQPTPAAPDPAIPPPSEVSTELTSSIPTEGEKEAKDLKQKEVSDHNSKIQELIESKTYAVPVGHLRRKRTLRVVVIGVVIAVVVSAVIAYAVTASM